MLVYFVYLHQNSMYYYLNPLCLLVHDSNINALIFPTSSRDYRSSYGAHEVPALHRPLGQSGTLSLCTSNDKDTGSLEVFKSFFRLMARLSGRGKTIFML